MLLLYRLVTYLAAPFLWILLRVRLGKKKEDGSRLKERQGIPSKPCPKGRLIWIHAASVGEAQSTLILIEKIHLQHPEVRFLITSGTVTSATLMAKRLPKHATHQYYPLDHPVWVNRFLDHWQPDLALWMESELWPNMLQSIKARRIPAVLVNARLSKLSRRRWGFLKSSAKKLLSTFNLILAQTEQDKTYYNSLGAQNVTVSDNIKYSAAPLPAFMDDLQKLQKAIGSRPIWLYASTHDGEETLAARLHASLKEEYQDLLTIIVPRHPERRDQIEQSLKVMGLNVILRGEEKHQPKNSTDIYVADTLGELGLFYRLSPIAVIGRSFSNDGGGGHNPIEAAQLDCAVLTGPHIQYQQKVFDDMRDNDAVILLQTEDEFRQELKTLLGDSGYHKTKTENAMRFADNKSNIIHVVMENLIPFLPSKQKEAA